MIRRINLYGGPGSGKSTTAARLFSSLKTQGLRVELVQEFIKPWAYEGRRPEGWDQLYIFTQQLRREERLLRSGQVDLVVSDSPLLLNTFYAYRNLVPGYKAIRTAAHEFEEQYPSVNIRLCRDVPYQQDGRYQSLEGARQIDEELERWLWHHCPEYLECSPCEFEKILDWVDGAVSR